MEYRIDGHPNEMHPFLQLGKYYYNKKRADKYVIDRLKHFGLKRPSGGWAKGNYSLTSNSTDIINLGNLMSMSHEVRETGHIYKMDSIFDNEDPWFGNNMNVTVSASNISLTPVSRKGEGIKMDGPLRYYATELELTNDIIYFRSNSCLKSSDHSFVMTSRHYRSYIFACISLIEAFTNRYVLGLRQSNTGIFKDLDKNFRIDEKLEIIYTSFNGKKFTELKNSKEWDHFLRLKKIRNAIIHSSELYYGAVIKDVARHFNYVNYGIGGLMRMIRNEHEKPILSFMDRLYNLPKVKYVKN